MINKIYSTKKILNQINSKLDKNITIYCQNNEKAKCFNKLNGNINIIANNDINYIEAQLLKDESDIVIIDLYYSNLSELLKSQNIIDMIMKVKFSIMKRAYIRVGL
jgi:hypothetical protein